MKLTVAVLALLCLGMGANASSKTLGVKINKTSSGVHVDLGDLTVPRVSLPEVQVAVQLKKPSINTTTIDLPEFTIPTTEVTIPTFPKPEIDLSALTALLSKGGNSSASLAGMLTRSNVDLSALQGAVTAALQKKAAMTTEAATALQTLATAVYQAKYNVTSRIADMALEVLSKRPNITIQKPEFDASALVALLSRKPNFTMPEFQIPQIPMPQIQMPQVDLSALQALLNKQVNIPVVDASSAINALLASKNITMPNLGMPAIDKAALVAALTKGRVNVTTVDINSIIDLSAMQQSLAQLAATVERPDMNAQIQAVVNMIEARKTAAAADLAALVSFMTGQQKNATADLVGFLNSLKQPRQINFTIPQLQLPQLPTVNVASMVESVQTLKNVTASMAADNLKSAAILAWLKDAGFYQIRDAVDSVQGGSVTINLGKEGASAPASAPASASAKAAAGKGA